MTDFAQQIRQLGEQSARSVDKSFESINQAIVGIAKAKESQRMKVEDTIATIDEIADEFDTLHFDEMSKESEVLVEDIKKTIKEGGFLGSSVDMKKLREFDAKVRKLGRRADASKRVGTLYKEAQALIAADPFITQAEKQRLMRDTQTMLADTDLLANLDIQEINGALNEKITGAYDDLLLFKSFVPTGKTRKSYKKYDKNNIDYTSIEAEMNNLLEGKLNPNTGKVDIDFNAQGQVAFEQAVTQIEQTTGRTVDRDQLKRRFISSESNILGMDEVNKTAIIDYQEKARRATEAYKASLKGKEPKKGQNIILNMARAFANRGIADQASQFSKGSDYFKSLKDAVKLTGEWDITFKEVEQDGKMYPEVTLSRIKRGGNGDGKYDPPSEEDDQSSSGRSIVIKSDDDVYQLKDALDDVFTDENIESLTNNPVISQYSSIASGLYKRGTAPFAVGSMTGQVSTFGREPDSWEQGEMSGSTSTADTAETPVDDTDGAPVDDTDAGGTTKSKKDIVKDFTKGRSLEMSESSIDSLQKSEIVTFVSKYSEEDFPETYKVLREPNSSKYSARRMFKKDLQNLSTGEGVKITKAEGTKQDSFRNKYNY